MILASRKLVPNPVVLDSCVIFPLYLRDTLFRAAEVGLYQAMWSEEILDGATRNLVNQGRMTIEKAARFKAVLKEAFPEAIAEVPDDLIVQMTNDPRDRHVVATAVVTDAKIIVTFNLKDFPVDALAPWGIQALHPDVFLNRLYEDAPEIVADLIQQQAEDLQNPPLTIEDLLTRLKLQVPVFADKMKCYFQDFN
ncbi:PIN domain-containing protein [Oscillatoria salina]|uniref:PIN domain-containing protein n=1 Tax=Oscillatoria salina TaxID=331517 RepID=UPI001CC9C7D6|nr:PIN domain-containing protein [Oscillatoria salina]MBZ8182236.1 PIN domain-containing protein [Oscillatoria salina IIICB1]